jgi:hypothetical protein
MSYLETVKATPAQSKAYAQSFATRSDLDTGWDCEGPEALRCPVSGDNYVHPLDSETISGHDDYKVWDGRGNLLWVRFWCESGHVFTLNFGFHKGNTTCYWEHVADSKPCTQCREDFYAKPGANAVLCFTCAGYVNR